MPSTRKRRRSHTDPPLTLKHLRADLAYRTYEQVRAELLRRHGWRMSVARVQQICATAEAKLRKRLADVFEAR
jgi:hypothetical protein